MKASLFLQRRQCIRICCMSLPDCIICYLGMQQCPQWHHLIAMSCSKSTMIAHWGILPYMVLKSPGITLYGHLATPLVMEYNYRAREYCVIIYTKYLNYSSDSVEQLTTSLKPMEIRVGHCKTPSMKTLKVVNVFEQHKKIVPWNILSRS